MLISAEPWTIHWARYFVHPGPWAIPIPVPVASQKLGTPGAGPTSGLLSGVWEIAPLTTFLMPTLLKIGIRSITRSRLTSMGSHSGRNSSLAASQDGPPLSTQASRVLLAS
jgi:hypothetical protein